MLNFIIGFLVCYIICAILATLDLEYVEKFLLGPFSTVLFPIAFASLWVWGFTRWAILGVPKVRYNWLCTRNPVTHLVGPFYLCKDKHAVHPYNKFFLIRVKKS